jgi:hypothetical protein
MTLTLAALCVKYVTRFVCFQGEMPPGIRTDIMDRPTSETAAQAMPPSAPPRCKPWHTSTTKKSNIQGALQQAGPSGAAAFSSDGAGPPWISCSVGSEGAGQKLLIHEARALLAKAAGSLSQGPTSSWQVGLACCTMCHVLNETIPNHSTG